MVLWLKALERILDQSTKIDTTHTLSLTHLAIFLKNLAYSNLCDCVSPRTHDRKLDRSTKIDITYAFVKIFIFSLIWLNSYVTTFISSCYCVCVFSVTGSLFWQPLFLCVQVYLSSTGFAY